MAVAIQPGSKKQLVFEQAAYQFYRATGELSVGLTPLDKIDGSLAVVGQFMVSETTVGGVISKQRNHLLHVVPCSEVTVFTGENGKPAYRIDVPSFIDVEANNIVVAVVATADITTYLGDFDPAMPGTALAERTITA